MSYPNLPAVEELFELTATNVKTLALLVSAPPYLPEAQVVRVEGIKDNPFFMPFSRAALEQYRPQVDHILKQLPQGFLCTAEGGGGGWTFLNSGVREDGRQWADFHADMELLLCIGLAAGRARYLLGREFWPSLPGAMPYFETYFSA